jgi:hypothetical protein
MGKESEEPMTNNCEKCGNPTGVAENDYGEFICNECVQNAEESAYERHCEDFHDGGCTRFNSLLDDQIAARRLK